VNRSASRAKRGPQNELKALLRERHVVHRMKEEQTSRETSFGNRADEV
jgi:hypothetical protein